MSLSRDTNGDPIRAGMTVEFTYGIPPTLIRGKVASLYWNFVVLTPGHTPSRCRLSIIVKYFGCTIVDDDEPQV